MRTIITLVTLILTMTCNAGNLRNNLEINLFEGNHCVYNIGGYVHEQLFEQWFIESKNPTDVLGKGKIKKDRSKS